MFEKDNKVSVPQADVKQNTSVTVSDSRNYQKLSRNYTLFL